MKTHITIYGCYKCGKTPKFKFGKDEDDVTGTYSCCEVSVTVKENMTLKKFADMWNGEQIKKTTTGLVPF